MRAMTAGLSLVLVEDSSGCAFDGADFDLLYFDVEGFGWILELVDEGPLMELFDENPLMMELVEEA